MKNKLFTIALSLVIAFSVCSEVAMAGTSDALRSSPTLFRYSAIAAQGSSSGKVVITYDVTANTEADSLGVSQMKIYKSDGGFVTTIYPTSLNNFKCQRRFEIVRKRRRNFVVFRRGGVTKISCFLAGKVCSLSVASGA